VIGPLIDPASREVALRAIFARLQFAEACCVVGMNDLGKTTLLALMQQSAVRERYAPALREPLIFIHVDCNLLAGGGERQLYTLLDAETRASALRAGVRLDVPERPAPDSEDALLAAVAFEDMLTALVARGLWPVIVFDEFDDLYRRLEARAVLALRAFENRLGPRVAYVVAVERPLRSLRNDTAEFEELFVGGTHALAPLTPRHATALVDRFSDQRHLVMSPLLPDRLAALSGGHPGLIVSACAAAQRLNAAGQSFDEAALAESPEVVAECESLWRRLADHDRVSLGSASSPIPLLHLRARAQQIHAGIVVHAGTGEVTIDGAPPASPLGPTEYRLLQALVARHGVLVTKDEISREVWPREQRLGGVDDARIDKLVDRLRAKIEPDPKLPKYLVTVRGLGYRLLAGPETAS
jgi:DNA-binding winged helix-turn-helix (wHTH) protein